MLTRLRRRLMGLVVALSMPFLPFPPNLLTVLGLLMSVLFLLSVRCRHLFLGLVFLLLSAYFDVIDGTVARMKGVPTLGGAFLDSFTDRLSDVIYAFALLYLEFDASWILALASGALLVSYARARAEGVLGARLEGIGFMERAERLIAIILVYLLFMLGYVRASSLVLYATVILIWITVLHRFIVYFWMISGSPPRAPWQWWPPPPGPP